MFIQKFTVCIFVFLLIAGCLGNKANQAPSPSVNKDIVGSCGAGLDNSVSLGLSAQLESRGGKADAGFQDNLRAAIIDLVKELEIPPADRATTIQNIYQQYLGCLEKTGAMENVRNENRRKLQLQAEVDSCMTSMSCDIRIHEGLCTCRKTVEEVAEEKGWSESRQSSAYFKHCGPKLREIKTCWSSDNLSLARSRCENVLAKAGIDKPMPPANSCSTT